MNLRICKEQPLRGIEQMTDMKTTCPFYQTNLGEMIQENSSEVLKERAANTVDLIVTSLPYSLICPKAYVNVQVSDYCAWFKPFAEQFFRVLKDTGSLVIFGQVDVDCLADYL
jgi:DNA modification methylase